MSAMLQPVADLAAADSQATVDQLIPPNPYRKADFIGFMIDAGKIHGAAAAEARRLTFDEFQTIYQIAEDRGVLSGEERRAFAIRVKDTTALNFNPKAGLLSRSYVGGIRRQLLEEYAIIADVARRMGRTPEGLSEIHRLQDERIERIESCSRNFDARERETFYAMRGEPETALLELRERDPAEYERRVAETARRAAADSPREINPEERGL